MSAKRGGGRQRQLLFLDFDGTLHPYGCSPGRYLERLPLLELWLRTHPTVDIVISSDWRHHHALGELAAMFSAELRPRIVGVTGEVMVWFGREPGPQNGVHYDPLYAPGARELEIWRWLEEHEMSQRAWCALDDLAWLFGKGCNELVEVDGTTGITTETLAELDGWLCGVGALR
ncbi:MAG: hypothetical protein RLZZ598_1282 [Pseudomonadota bacterium]|jgi:hypothetical protein